MRRGLGLFVLFALLACEAQADMVEVKGKGFLNGKIISQDNDVVLFKDADGETHTVAKSDVMFMEVDNADLGQAKGKFMDTAKRKLRRFWVSAKQSPAKLKAWSKRWTTRFTDKMSKPLDRSSVNAKSEAFSKVTDEANQNVIKLAKRNKEAISKAGGASRDGRFASLD